MAVPDFQSFMLPVLKLAGDQKEHQSREALDYCASAFDLTEEDRQVRLPSGTQAVAANRTYWAIVYLKKAGLLTSPRRGVFIITQEGMKVLGSGLSKIDVKFLRQFPQFTAFHSGNSADSASVSEQPESTGAVKTPEELLDEANQEIRQKVASELLEKIAGCSPDFFERLVVDLMVSMGYGGSLEAPGQVVGGSGDEGIDGLIKEDKLGLDVIYLQAKRWNQTVGRPEIQKFVGALQGQRAKKGVFITTSTFAKGAYEYVSQIESKVVLIDGKLLAELMIDHNLGTSTTKTYHIKRIDSDYFAEE